MALAAGGKSYTPPASVHRFITQLSLLPALYAESGEGIIVSHEVKESPKTFPYIDEVLSKKLTLFEFGELPDARVSPWGWNLALRHTLVGAGLSDHNLPTLDDIDRLRDLAHRKTTVAILRKCGSDESRMPRFLQSGEEVRDCVNEYEECGKGYVVKLPWSSSGRGVFFSPGKEAAVRACGRQGGVLIEPLWDKALDFATEWECADGKVCFRGYSLFNNSGKCNYSGNIVAPQAQLREQILKHCSEEVLKESEGLLAQALTDIIAPYYSGPLGVDMLCDKTGAINLCVELNLRMTMGHVALELYERCRPATPTLFSPGNHFPASPRKF